MKSMYDLFIRNGTLVTPEGITTGDIAIAEQQIAAIGPMLDEARADRSLFALLHGVTSVFFVVKLVAIAVLAWRLSGDAAAARATAAEPTS